MGCREGNKSGFPCPAAGLEKGWSAPSSIGVFWGRKLRHWEALFQLPQHMSPGLEPRGSDSWARALLLHLHIFRWYWKKKVSHETEWLHWIGWSFSRITNALGVDQMHFCGSKALLQYRIQNFPNNQCSEMISKWTDADQCTQRRMVYFVTASGSELLTRKMTDAQHISEDSRIWGQRRWEF